MRFYLLLLLLVLLAACDPLAPEVTPQVLVVTNTPAQTSGTIPAVNNPIPTRVIVQPTATVTPRPVAALPTATVPPCYETEGRLFESAFNSAITGELVAYNIYLPPCFFESGRRYPYLILLHGSGYTMTQWQDLDIQTVLDTGINDKSLAPMVVVMPAGGIPQEDNTFAAGTSYEDMLLNELIPTLEQNFCLLNNRAGRALGGISRGGFWAFSIAFRHPDLFAAVGGHSPFFAPDNAPPSHNPLALAENAPGIETLRIYLDNAQSDSAGPNIILLSNTLRGRNVAHDYAIQPVGGHDNDYWAEHLPAYLAFYGESWIKEVAGLPSCQS